MSSVDDRAVHMTFDNASFEKNLAETMKSMDSLKKSLDFSNSKKGFADLEAASRGFNLGGVASSVEGVSAKFLALGTIAITTLANIVNRAVDAGINIAKSLTIAPISAGFSDYNAKLTSVQTITNATGESIDVVSGFFKELDTYADKTVFNLSDMTSAFAKFTNAGISMDVAVPAIKGIANMTALAGQGADAAAIGMYNLSQSLAGGFLTTTDYKSLNLANIATKQWKDYMIEAAVAAGTLKKTGDDTFQVLADGSDTVANSAQLFNNELSRGWANSDILIGVLGDFGDTTTEIGKKAQAAAQDVKSLPMMLDTLKAAVGTGWTDTFEIVLGNLDESKALFTDLTTSIGGFLDKGAQARNDLLKGWKDLGGRTKLIEGVKDMFGALQQTLGAVTTQFHRFFGTLDSQTLYNITESFANFMDRLRNSDEFFDRLSTIFGGIFATLKIGVAIVKGIAGVFVDLFSHFSGGGGGAKVLDFIDRIALGMISLEQSLVEGGGIASFFDDITSKIIAFGDEIKWIFDQIKNNPLAGLKNIFGQIFDALLTGDFHGGVLAEDSPIINFIFNIREGIEKGIDVILGILGGFGDKINNILGTSINFHFPDIHIPDSIVNFFKNLFGNVDANTSNSLELGGGLDRISTAISTLWDVIKTIGDGIDKFFSVIFDIGGWIVDRGKGVIDFFENIGPNIQKFVMSDEFDKLLEFMQSLGVLMGGAGIAGIAKNGLKINADLSGGFLGQLANAFKKGGLFDVAKKNLEGLTGVLDSMQTSIKAGALLKIAEAVALLTASVVALSFVNPESLAKALTAMSVGFGQLLASFAILNQISAGPKSGLSFAAVSTGLIALSTAILILSGAVAVMATMNWEELARGLTGTAGALVILVGATKLISSGGISLIATGVGLSAIAVAMTLLAGAIKVFSLMSWEEIGKGMAAVAAGLLIIAGAMQLMPASTILIGPGLVAVAFALTELGAALLIFATMSWEEIGKGMTVLAGGLLIIAGAMNLMPVSTILTGPGLIAIATGLVILGEALKTFGDMSWEEIGKSMTVLASSLLILAGAMALMSGGIPGAVAVGIMAASLLLLNKSLKEFAKLSWKELGKSLAVMATALAALGIAAVAMSATGATAGIFLLGVALVALGAGFAVIGVGAGLLAEAFQIMAAAGTAGIDVFMYAIDQLLIRLPEMAKGFAEALLNIADTILASAPSLIEKLGKVIGALLVVVKENAPEFGLAATAWILALLKTVRDSYPDLVKTGFEMLLAILKGIKDNIKEITQNVGEIIIAFNTEFAKQLPDIVESGLKVIRSFLVGLTDTDLVADVVEAGVKFLVKVIEGVTRDIDDILDAGFNIVEQFILGIGDHIDDLIDTGAKFIGKIIEGIGKGAIALAWQGTLLLVQFMKAISSNTLYIVNTALDIVITFINGLADAIDSHRTDLYKAGLNLGLAIADGFTFGLASKGITVTKKVGGFFSNVVSSAKNTLDSHSPSMVFYALGEDVANGFILGLNDNTTAVENSSTRLFTAFSDKFTAALADTSAMMQNSNEFNPTITPVLDLTSVQATAGQINGLLGSQALTAGVSVQAANQLLAETTPDNSDDNSDNSKKSVTFIQTNNSPEALNTAKIYKNTRSQFALAVEELENA